MWVARCFFDKNKCDVIYDGNIILQGKKDTSTNLWTVPINGHDMWSALPQSSPVVDRALHARPDIHPGINIANFTHSGKTRANRVKFPHQLLCNPVVSRLDMYHTNVLMYRTMVLLACPTKVRC